jgi:hypothetical protein
MTVIHRCGGLLRLLFIRRLSNMDIMRSSTAYEESLAYHTLYGRHERLLNDRLVSLRVPAAGTSTLAILAMLMLPNSVAASTHVGIVSSYST